MPRPHRWPIVGLIGLALPVLYVLSYAPVYRLVNGSSVIVPEGMHLLIDAPNEPPRLWKPLYVPVEWAIDDTPLQSPLLWWADQWGVGHGLASQSSDSVTREIFTMLP